MTLKFEMILIVLVADKAGDGEKVIKRAINGLGGEGTVSNFEVCGSCSVAGWRTLFRERDRKSLIERVAKVGFQIQCDEVSVRSQGSSCLKLG